MAPGRYGRCRAGRTRAPQAIAQRAHADTAKVAGGLACACAGVVIFRRPARLPALLRRNAYRQGYHVRERAAKRTNYTVKNVETVAAGKDVQARLFTLAPGEVIPWHSHSEIADHFFVLDGELTVETRAPADNRTLGIGERYQINAGHAHQASNRGTRDCRFLIVQGVGRYDFLRSPL